MTTLFDTLEAEALKLAPEERAQLADHLLASLAGEGENEDNLFAEVERRIAEVESRVVQPIPIGEAIAHARRALA